MIVDAAELLGQLLLQDLQRCGTGDDAYPDGGVSLKDGASKDRMVSVHDPEMHHGHKSSRRRSDGHKAAVAVDTDSQLITAVELLPGNAADNLGALELVEQGEASAAVLVVEAMGDRLRRRRHPLGICRRRPQAGGSSAGTTQPQTLPQG